MTANISLLDYQRQAASATRPRLRRVDPGRSQEPPWTREAAILILEGWEYKTRLGRRIWRLSDPTVLGGFRGWYGEDMAHKIYKETKS